MAWLYDASLGRYTQPDPLSLVDGPNRYAYAASAPTLYTDPRGEYLIPVLVGAAVGAGLDLGLQLWRHGGRFDCVDWKEVVFSGAAGALGGTGFGAASRVVSNASKAFKKAKRVKVPKRPPSLRPDKNARGPHTVFKRDQSGKVVRYETFKVNTLNPTGFDSVKRVDLIGKSHYNKRIGKNIPTPHVHSRNIPGGVRSAQGWEIPR